MLHPTLAAFIRLALKAYDPLGQSATDRSLRPRLAVPPGYTQTGRHQSTTECLLEPLPELGDVAPLGRVAVEVHLQRVNDEAICERWHLTRG